MTKKTAVLQVALRSGEALNVAFVDRSAANQEIINWLHGNWDAVNKKVILLGTQHVAVRVDAIEAMVLEGEDEDE